jgi:hypothetical protein
VADGHQSIVLLNSLVSISKSRAPQEYKPPTESGLRLLQILDQRRKNKIAVEFVGATDDDDEGKRIALGKGFSFLRLGDAKFQTDGSFTYVTMLFQHANQLSKSFPVINTATFEGREIEGEIDERGATSAHVVVRLPSAQSDSFDDGSYRCVIETAPAITRREIQTFLCRQLKREAAGWKFAVQTFKEGKKPTTKDYVWYPRLELHSDVGRSLNGMLGRGSVLSSLTFTKRRDRQSIGKETEVDHQDFFADLEVRVSAKQAPDDPAEKQTWLKGLRSWYEDLGYETKLYWKHQDGGVLSGDVHQAVASATDLVMCPREVISLSAPPNQSKADINAEIAGKMRELLDTEHLWQRDK